ncbi:DUF5610 domain-containing protein [bacterium]|jgi:hypothetical protein|nr:DUF5610 domain-containing protein [bacterium]
MVNGVGGSSQNSQFQIQNSNNRAKARDPQNTDQASGKERNTPIPAPRDQKGSVETPKAKNPLSELGFSGSFDFSLSMSKSMQIVEGESKRSVSQSMSLEFNLSVDANGRLGGSFAGPGVPEEASNVDEAKDDDPFSAENTANRIIDFVKRAAELTKKLGISNLETDEEKDKFATMQTEAVKLGFKQARNILGSLDDDREGRVNNTYDLVLDGLDRFFHPEKYEDEESEVVAQPADQGDGQSGTGEGSFSSSKSFSLNFQVKIEGNGEFNPEDLNSFVDDAFSQVQDVFNKFLGGGSDSESDSEEGSFNPANLFSLDQLNPDRVRSLIGE